MTKEELRAMRLRARQKILARDEVSNKIMAERIGELANTMTDVEPNAEPTSALDLLKLMKTMK